MPHVKIHRVLKILISLRLYVFTLLDCATGTTWPPPPVPPSDWRRPGSNWLWHTGAVDDWVSELGELSEWRMKRVRSGPAREGLLGQKGHRLQRERRASDGERAGARETEEVIWEKTRRRKNQTDQTSERKRRRSQTERREAVDQIPVDDGASTGEADLGTYQTSPLSQGKRWEGAQGDCQAQRKLSSRDQEVTEAGNGKRNGSLSSLQRRRVSPRHGPALRWPQCDHACP